jgi:cell division septal protein FtsQ
MNMRFGKQVAVVLALVFAAGGIYFLLRESGVTRIRKVEIIGLTGEQAQRLRVAALKQSTLGVDEGALRSAIGNHPPIRSLRVSTSFPDEATLTVSLFEPVAAVGSTGSNAIAVAADGTVLQGVPTGSLPKIDGVTLNGRVQSKQTARLVAVAASAPRSFRVRMASLVDSPGHGIVVTLNRGPLVYLGDASDLSAKWTSLAAVLSDPASIGASYVDVRVPRRPAFGGVQGGVQGGVDPADPNQSLTDGGAGAATDSTGSTDGGGTSPGTTSTDSTDPSDAGAAGTGGQ